MLYAEIKLLSLVNSIGQESSNGLWESAMAEA
jgi:hypothetical protein